jgi:hypothetical protein
MIVPRMPLALPTAKDGPQGPAYDKQLEDLHLKVVYPDKKE